MQALVALFMAAAIVGIVPSRQVFVRRPSLLVAIGVLFSLSALQLVPLPASLIEYLDPAGAALRDDGSELLGISPWRSISLDCPGTLRALTFAITLFSVAIVALRMSTSERGRYRVLACVAGLLGVVAVVTAVHEVVGASKLYGFYSLEHATPRILGPLLNENHLGGLMAVGTLLAMGLVAYSRQPIAARVAWLVAAGACGATTVATSSRGATLALLVGAAILCGLLLAQRFFSHEPKRRSAAFATRSLPMAVVAVCAVVVVIYSSAGRVEQQLSGTTIEEVQHPRSKYAAWRSAQVLLEDAPWVGVGRGAFEPAFTRVHPASGMVTFSHLENEYIQAAVDWGIPGALLLAISVLWMSVVAIRRWKNGPLAAAALAALGAIAIQSTVDFGVELLGLAVPMTAIAATITYVPTEQASSRKLILARTSRLALIAGLVIAALFLMSARTTTIDEDHRALSRASSMEDVRAEIQRHPLDYYGYQLAAELQTRRGDRQAISLLNHALLLHPTHPGLHHTAARLLLFSNHADQAAIEYATALRSTPSPQVLIGEIVKLLTKEQAVAAIPTSLSDPDDVIRILTDLKQGDIATAWLEKLLVSRPRDVHVCELLYKSALDRGDLAAAEVAGRSCVEIAPDRQTRYALARVMLNKHGYSEVLRLLNDVEQWDGRIDEKFDGWLLRCDASIQLHALDESERCIHRLDASGIVTPDRRPAVLSRLEAISEARRAGSGSGTVRQ